MKVTIEGTEYNVVPSPDRACFFYNSRHQNIAKCVFTDRTGKECQTMPCRNPSVIFLTDAGLAKLVTSRLTE